MLQNIAKILQKDYAEQILHKSRIQFKDMKSKKTKITLEIGEEEFTNNLFETLHKDGYYIGYKVELEEFEKLYKKLEELALAIGDIIVGIDIRNIKSINGCRGSQ